MSKDEIEKRVPNLRFKGFTDDWMQEKLETQVTDLKSYPLPRKFETTEESSYRYVHYGDIHTGIANVINDVENLPKIVKGKYETLDKGDLILADASEDYQGIAWPAILNVDPQENILAGLHTIALRPNQNIDSMFLYHTFLNTDFRKFGYRMGTGMKVFGISKNNLYKYNLSKPINIEEQERISSLLIKLNNIITLEQEKNKKIKLMKKALIERLYPSNNNIPDLRFDQYKIPWEKYKLGKLLSVKDIKKSINEEYPLMSFTSTNGVTPKGDRYDRSFLVKSLNKKYKRTDLNDIIYSSNNLDVGAIGLNDYGKASISVVYEIFEVNNRFNPYFVSNLIQKPNILNQILKYRQGALYGQYKIYPKDFLTVDAYFPNKNEQENISSILKKLTKLNTNAQSIIKNYEIIKEYLLQNLFI